MCRQGERGNHWVRASSGKSDSQGDGMLATVHSIRFTCRDWRGERKKVSSKNYYGLESLTYLQDTVRVESVTARKPMGAVPSLAPLLNIK